MAKKKTTKRAAITISAERIERKRKTMLGDGQTTVANAGENERWRHGLERRSVRVDAEVDSGH